MITEALLELFADATVAVTDVIPSPEIPGLVNIASGWSHVFDLNWFLPIMEVTSMVLFLMSIGPALLITSITSWLVIGVARGGSPTL